MRTALFAADHVGLQTARFLGTQDEAPVCLVLDGTDRRSLNADIQRATGLEDECVIHAGQWKGAEFADQLSSFEPDLCILAWWPFILKAGVLRVPRLGCLNFHPSLLPHGRGKAPNFWALRNQTPFGVTIHWVDEGIDTGDIAYQREIPVSWCDTGETLYYRSRNAVVDLFKEKWPEIQAGHIPRQPQQDGAVCHFHRDLDAASHIDLDAPWTGRDLLNLLRARTFEPHPAAWFEENGQRYQVRVSIFPEDQEEDSNHDSRAIRRA